VTNSSSYTVLFGSGFVTFGLPPKSAKPGSCVLSQYPLTYSTISSTLYHLTFGPVGLSVCLHAEKRTGGSVADKRTGGDPSSVLVPLVGRRRERVSCAGGYSDERSHDLAGSSVMASQSTA
jgi:hypothetical protein